MKNVLKNAGKFALLFLASCAWGYNVSRVQEVGNGTDATGVPGPFTCVLPGVTAGDLLIVVAGCSNASFSFTDSASTPVLIDSKTWDVGAFREAYWQVNNAAAGTHTFTWTIGGAGSCDFPNITCVEYAGQDPQAPIDGVIFGTGTGSSMSSGDMTTHIPNDILFSSAGGAGGVLTATSPLVEFAPSAQVGDSTANPYSAGSTAHAQWTESDNTVQWFSLGILISPPRQPTGSILIQ